MNRKIKESELCVVSLSDDNYAQHLGAMFVSMLTNMSLDVSARLYVLSTGLTDRNKELLQRSVEQYNSRIEFITVAGAAYEKYDSMAGGSRETYLRLAIADALPAAVEKVICIDSDVIVTGDVFELWGMDLNGRTIAAVTDQWASSQCDTLGIPRGVYFNAGILVMDLAKWRANDVSGKAVAFLDSRKGKLVFQDQDALNAVLFDDWLPLPHEWNAHSLIIDAWTSPAPPALIHYTGRSKPWQFDNVHPFKDEYYKYLRMTEWSGYKPKISFKGLIKRMTRPWMPWINRWLPKSAITVIHKAKLRYLS